MSCYEYEVSILPRPVKVYTAHLNFKDYDKIFAFAKWKCPVSYRAYRDGAYGFLRGIEAVFADGTSDRLSFCDIRDVIEKNWNYLKSVLNEDGESLDDYTETIGDHDTLTLRCSRIVFRISETNGVVFDRIMGITKHECII